MDRRKIDVAMTSFLIVMSLIILISDDLVQGGVETDLGSMFLPRIVAIAIIDSRSVSLQVGVGHTAEGRQLVCSALWARDFVGIHTGRDMSCYDVGCRVCDVSCAAVAGRTPLAMCATTCHTAASRGGAFAVVRVWCGVAIVVCGLVLLQRVWCA